MYVFIHIHVNMHVCMRIQVNMPICDHLHVNIHQTCTYIDEYAYAHKYACIHSIFRLIYMYVCITGEYRLI
jgi:hypothetical protein